MYEMLIIGSHALNLWHTVRDRLHYHDDIFCAAGSMVRLLHRDASIAAMQHNNVAVLERNLTRKQMPGVEFLLDSTAGSAIGTTKTTTEHTLRRFDPHRTEIQSEQFGDYRTLGGDTNYNATYFAYHIRRGDFQVSCLELNGVSILLRKLLILFCFRGIMLQYKEYNRMAAEDILNSTQHLLDDRVTKIIYIATDEKNLEFFKPFELNGRFKLRFLSDYLVESGVGGSPGFNQNHIGMIEQVICANAHTFIGTPLSTFTGYITRMRGMFVPNRLHVSQLITGDVWHCAPTRC
jgi:hypothetical protein